MKYILSFSFFLLYLTFSFSEENLVSKNTLFLKLGNSYPIYGHWGDKDAGFNKSSNYKLMFIKDIDENISYAIQSGYSTKYKNKNTDLNVRIFSFTPVLLSWLGLNEHKYFLYTGAGLYHITQIKSNLFPSDSITEFGINLGAGITYNFLFRLKWGLNLEWSHIFNMKDEIFDLNSANNLDVNIIFIKKF